MRTADRRSSPAVRETGAALGDLMRRPFGGASLVVVVAAVIVAVFAPIIATGAPVDELSRLVYGTRTSLNAGLLGVAVAATLGVLSGLLAGANLSRFDAVAGWIACLALSVPAIVFLLAVVAEAGNNITIAMVAVGALAAPSFFDRTRNEVLAARDYSDADSDDARAAVPSDVRPIGRLASILGVPLIRLACVTGAVSMLTHAGLTFLGLGNPVIPSWGAMLGGAVRAHAEESIWAPGALLVVTVAAFAFLGLAIGRANPRDADRSRAGGSDQRAQSEVGQSDHRPQRSGTSDRMPRSVRTVPDAPRPSDDPMPSNWFRSSALLDVRGLCISPAAEPHAPKLVSGISLAVTRGEVIGLLGEPGSGTTEIALAVAGLLPAAAAVRAGSILFDEQELIGMSERSLSRLRGLKISYVPREPMRTLDPACTIGRQLAGPMRVNLGLSRATARRRALELLDRVGIADPRATFASFPRDVTGEIAQRVLIAGAVSCDPELLVADDPTDALDGTSQAGILELLRDLQRERQLTMILATHSFGVIASNCHRVAVVQAGTVVEYASVRDLFDSPKHPYTRHLLDSARRIAPVSARQWVTPRG